MNVLVTGGLGFIGSHTSVELLNKGYEITIVDNLVNSNIKVLKNIQKITGKKPEFKEIDLRDKKELTKLFECNNFDGIIHFAALKSVNESIKKPKLYKENNIGGTKNLLEVITSKKHRTNLIFSSSCTVYGQSKKLPIDENCPTNNIESPYGETKIKCEEIILEAVKKYSNLNAISLRYFNPIGAHESSLIGEFPNGIPENLIPYITQTAIGIRNELTIFGNDYPTRDGTCIRDYIHINDLALAHISSLNFLSKVKNKKIYDFFNVGTGKGITVLELINMFEQTNSLKINYKIGNKRKGDITSAYADISKIKTKIGWFSKKSISDALKTAWEWQKRISNYEN